MSVTGAENGWFWGCHEPRVAIEAWACIVLTCVGVHRYADVPVPYPAEDHDNGYMDPHASADDSLPPSYDANAEAHDGYLDIHRTCDGFGAFNGSHSTQKTMSGVKHNRRRCLNGCYEGMANGGGKVCEPAWVFVPTCVCSYECGFVLICACVYLPVPACE